MQSFGQLAAYGFGLAILIGVSRYLGLAPDEKDYEKASRVIDIVWRVTIGVGAAPALAALFLRRIIPETPLYLAYKGKFDAATEAVRELYDPHENIQFSGASQGVRLMRSNSAGSNESAGKRRGLLAPFIQYFGDIKQYLSKNSRWRALLGVMIAWYLLDVAYYGLGLDSPRTISAIWLSEPTTLNFGRQGSGGCTTTWAADPARPDISIYEMLKQTCIRNIITITSGTLSGSIIILFAIDYLPRVTWMGWMFVVLAALFAINGGTFFVTFETEKHALTITLYVLAQVICNLGPNTMTFIIPAELFATKYRATFYSYASAAGKLGAITIQIAISYGVFGGDVQDFERKFAGMLLAFCPLMLLGAFITWVWIPEVQYPRGYHSHDDDHRDENASDNASSAGDEGRPTFQQRLKFANRTLEDIAENPEEGQRLGMRNNLSRLCGMRRRRGTGAHEEEQQDRHADPEPFLGGAQGNDMQEIRLSANHDHHSRHSGNSHSPRTRSPYEEEQDIVDNIELRQARYSQNRL
jgi:MFS transporter, PHS family, inorganic phosphate transporter